MAVMEAESTCRSDAVGDTTLTYQGSGRIEGMSCGLFQVRVLAGRPSCDALVDPATNVAWAYKVYSASSSWKPWSVWTSGKYLKFL